MKKLERKITFDDICKYLEGIGLECISMNKGNDRVYTNDSIEIRIKETIPEEEWTKEDEERVKERLRALGYMD